jgi:hypothetical protein
MHFADLVKQPATDFDGLVEKHRRIGDYALGLDPKTFPTYEEDVGDYPWQKTGDPRHDHVMPIVSKAYRSLWRIHMDPMLLEDAPISDPSQREFPVLQGMRRALVRFEFQTYGLPQPEWPITGRRAAILLVAPHTETKIYLYASKVTRPFQPPYILQWACDLPEFDSTVFQTALVNAIDKILCYDV